MAEYKQGDSATADTLMVAAGKDNAALGFLMWVLGALAVSVEVFLRRDFGERYFTRTKYALGLFVLLSFKAGSNYASRTPSLGELKFDAETGRYILKATEAAFNAWLLDFFLLAYIVLGSYHTFRLWWRNGTGRPLHSRDHGLTWLEPIGAVALAIPNFLIDFVMQLYALTLPEHERPWLMNALPFLRDARGFTEKVIEPLTLIVLAMLFGALGADAVAAWLLFSMFALVLFTTIRHEQYRSQMLDMQDRQIEAKDMSSAMFGDTESLRVPYATKKAMFVVTNIVENSSPEAMETIRRNTPNIAEAMEALNPKLKKMTVKKEPPAAPASPADYTPPVVNQEPPEPPEEEKPGGESGTSVQDAMKNLKTKKS